MNTDIDYSSTTYTSNVLHCLLQQGVHNSPLASPVAATPGACMWRATRETPYPSPACMTHTGVPRLHLIIRLIVSINIVFTIYWAGYWGSVHRFILLKFIGPPESSRDETSHLCIIHANEPFHVCVWVGECVCVWGPCVCGFILLKFIGPSESS